MSISFIDANDAWKQHIASAWGEIAARHMHLEDGFSILALDDTQPVGLISVYWRSLLPPLVNVIEGYIDIIEVHAEHRRKGIGSRLIDLAANRARIHGAYQLRAWSSADKTEAIPMWKVLGFGMCPTVTFPNGQKVDGYFVTKILQPWGPGIVSNSK